MRIQTGPEPRLLSPTRGTGLHRVLATKCDENSVLKRILKWCIANTGWKPVPQRGFKLLRRKLALAGSLLSLLLMTGCASSSGPSEGPRALSTSSVDSWDYKGDPGWKLGTSHYSIFTTIKDNDVRSMLPQVMEGAYSLYLQLVPGVPLSTRPMDCFIFNERMEFNEYTKGATGKDSAIYLQIRRGGYALGDRYVSYYIGVNNTASVAAHEGWHQFVARNFKGRLPPFLEEGLATTFEGVEFKENLPRWNVGINPLRADGLRRSIDAKNLWPTELLIRTHAGEVVNRTGEKIDAYYSQCWAFAKFLREAEGGKYAPALRLWLAETAAGTVYDPSHTHNRAGLPWNPGAVKPMLEHYLGMSLPEIDKAYQAYMNKVAFEEYPKQWNLSQ